MPDRIHITQDDYGYWMLVRQRGIGLTVESWGAERVDPLIDEAWSEEDAEVRYSESQGQNGKRIGADDYAMPEPRRARRPYTRHRTSMPRPEARV